MSPLPAISMSSSSPTFRSASPLPAMLMEAYPAILLHVYLLTVAIFALFIYGVGRLRRW